MARTTDKDILLATTYPKGYATIGNPEPDTWVKVFVTVRALKVQRFSVRAKYRGVHYEAHDYLYCLSEATEKHNAICYALSAKRQSEFAIQTDGQISAGSISV